MEPSLLQQPTRPLQPLLLRPLRRRAVAGHGQAREGVERALGALGGERSVQARKRARIQRAEANESSGQRSFRRDPDRRTGRSCPPWALAFTNLAVDPPPGWANARSLRSLLSAIVDAQSERLAQSTSLDNEDLG